MSKVGETEYEFVVYVGQARMVLSIPCLDCYHIFVYCHILQLQSELEAIHVNQKVVCLPFGWTHVLKVYRDHELGASIITRVSTKLFGDSSTKAHFPI